MAPRHRTPRHEKSVNLALQGGGAHGAFTWGVLDRLFEDGRLWIEAISGTSAGAMNAVVAAHGMYDGGGEGARAALEDFWRRVSVAGRTSLLQRGPWARLTGKWSLEQSPIYLWLDIASRVASPYDLNPIGINPLRDLVAETVDFDKVRGCGDLPVYVSATNVETGRVRVFSGQELTLDALMASACLPSMFHAVEIDGTPYWDGGFMGNPVLFPFFDLDRCDDLLIVQINPIYRPGTPKSAREIHDRVNEITFNSSLLLELRQVDFVRRMAAEGRLDPERYHERRVHMIEARKRMRPLGASSKLNAEWAFLTHLRDIGREAADRWLAAHFDDVGVRSSLDLSAFVAGRRPAPTPAAAAE
jgi:NTE family protein